LTPSVKGRLRHEGKRRNEETQKRRNTRRRGRRWDWRSAGGCGTGVSPVIRKPAGQVEHSAPRRLCDRAASLATGSTCPTTLNGRWRRLASAAMLRPAAYCGPRAAPTRAKAGWASDGAKRYPERAYVKCRELTPSAPSAVDYRRRRIGCTTNMARAVSVSVSTRPAPQALPTAAPPGWVDGGVTTAQSARPSPSESVSA